MKTWKDIGGWFDFQDIYDSAVAKAPTTGGRFVEVGCWLGSSTVYMAQAIRSSGKEIEFFAVDTWEGSRSDITGPLAKEMNSGGSTLYDRFLGNLADCGVSDLVQAVQGRSVEAAKLFEGESLDFVFIDADHEYEAIKADIAAWLPKVKIGGVIAGHDIGWGGVKQAVYEKFPGQVEVVASSWHVVVGGR